MRRTQTHLFVVTSNCKKRRVWTPPDAADAQTSSSHCGGLVNLLTCNPTGARFIADNGEGHIGASVYRKGGAWMTEGCKDLQPELYLLDVMSISCSTGKMNSSPLTHLQWMIPDCYKTTIWRPQEASCIAHCSEEVLQRKSCQDETWLYCAQGFGHHLPMSFETCLGLMCLWPRAAT